MKRQFLISVLLLACVYANGQSVQYGYTEEYRGAKDKKPLTGVNINAGGATTKSGSGGKFKLEFNSLKVGDRVNADVNNVVNLKGYVLFNKEAVEQWTVSGKSVYFRIVLCKKTTFDDLVKTYYNVSDKSYREQLKREREKADQLKRDGDIQQQEYERLLKEADGRYQRAFKTIKENAELVARIDESELEGDEKEILRLAKEGRLDEAVELIKKDSADVLLDAVAKKLNYAVAQERFYREKKEEAIDEMAKLFMRLKNNITVLQLTGGKDNLELCGQYWKKIIMTDSTDLKNVCDGAHFFYEQQNFSDAERFYLMAYNQLQKQTDVDTVQHICDLAKVQNKLAGIYHRTHSFKLSEEYYLKSLANYERLFKYYPELYRKDWAGLLNNVGNFYKNMRSYDKAENYLLLSLEQRRILFNQDSDAYRKDLAAIENALGNLYRGTKDFDKSIEYSVRAVSDFEVLFNNDPDNYRVGLLYAQVTLGNIYGTVGLDSLCVYCFLRANENAEYLYNKNPEAYSSTLALIQNNLAATYKHKGLYQKAEEYCLKSLSIREVLFKSNPSVYRADLAMTYKVMAGIYDKMNDNEKSTFYICKSKEMFVKLYEIAPKRYLETLAFVDKDMASILSKTGKYKEALDNINEAIGLNPERASFYDIKGVILLKIGDAEGALQMWRKVMSLDHTLDEQYIDEGQSDLYKGLKERGLVE